LAADVLMGLIAPGHKGRELGGGTVIAIGVGLLVLAVGFAGLGIFALTTPDIELDARFYCGVFGLASLCLLGAVPCFVPSSRRWALPLLVFLLAVIFVILTRVRVTQRAG
jgi:hypothetical protein